MRSDVVETVPQQASVTGLDACAAQCVHPDRVAAVQAAAPSEGDLARASSVFKLIGDPTRTRLLYALVEADELCVCDLAAATQTAESTVSQALRMLRAAGVVRGRREGRNVYYRVDDAHVRMLLDVTREHVLHADTVERRLATHMGGRA
ncbi:MAG TPA: metalloregulator ArsR/SmtB family transcription factor [Marmoricola sp.]|nr:metalloregulator ArsR/SmtB family transcription factor [Marmoricola sp.]